MADSFKEQGYLSFVYQLLSEEKENPEKVKSEYTKPSQLAPTSLVFPDEFPYEDDYFAPSSVVFPDEFPYEFDYFSTSGDSADTKSTKSIDTESIKSNGDEEFYSVAHPHEIIEQFPTPTDSKPSPVPPPMNAFRLDSTGAGQVNRLIKSDKEPVNQSGKSERGFIGARKFVDLFPQADQTSNADARKTYLKGYGANVKSSGTGVFSPLPVVQAQKEFLIANTRKARLAIIPTQPESTIPNATKTSTTTKCAGTGVFLPRTYAGSRYY